MISWSPRLGVAGGDAGDGVLALDAGEGGAGEDERRGEGGGDAGRDDPGSGGAEQRGHGDVLRVCRGASGACGRRGTRVSHTPSSPSRITSAAVAPCPRAARGRARRRPDLTPGSAVPAAAPTPRRRCSRSTTSFVRVDLGDVGGGAAGVLHRAVAGEGVEQGLLALEDADELLVDRVPGQQPVHRDPAGLAHAVGPGDGLALGARLPLRFHDDHRRGGLQVDADPAGLDLVGHDREARLGREVVDQGQALRSAACRR